MSNPIIRVSKTNTIIELGYFGIEITLGEKDEDGRCSGKITSDLHKTVPVPHAEKNSEAYWEWKKEKLNITEYNGAMEGIETLIVSHACAGIDVTAPDYLKGIEIAVEGLAKNI